MKSGPIVAPELAELFELWPKLPETIRQSVLMIARSSAGQKGGANG
jgi:hypothetical protein